MEKDFKLKPFAKDIAELPKKSFNILCKILKKNKTDGFIPYNNFESSIHWNIHTYCKYASDKEIENFLMEGA